MSIDQAAWLLLLSEGQRKKSLSRLAMSDDVLDALLNRGSIALTDGIAQITAKGLDEVARLTELTTADPATLRSRAKSLGARVTPIPQSRKTQ
ncbi:MAG TPA: hypothetical protein VFI49_13135 [Rudaea sp.]|nr:hypothetical protein [Rudaea sp.]